MNLLIVNLLIFLGILLRDFRLDRFIRVSEILILLSLVIFYGFYRKIDKSYWYNNKKIILSFLPFLLISLISLFLNGVTILSVIKYLEYCYVFAFALIIGRIAKENISLTLQAFVDVAFFASFLAIAQFVFQDFYFFAPAEINIYRSSSFMADSNYFSIYLAIAYVCAYILAGDRFKSLNIFKGILISVGIAFTLSRSGLLLFGVGSLFLIIYFLKNITPLRKKLIWLLILQVFFLFLFNTFIRWNRTFCDVDTFTSGRISKVASSFPNPKFDGIEFLFGKGSSKSSESGVHIHNTYLTLFYEYGLLGLIAFLGFWIFVLLQIFKKIRFLGHGFNFLGILMGLLLVFVFLDAQYELVIWFVLGLCFADLTKFSEKQAKVSALELGK